MYILKAGEGCILKMRLVEANGAPIELRNARFVQAILHLPNEATMLCEDVRFDEVSQLVFVRLSAKDELTMEGVYGININALFDGRVVTSAVLDFAEVKANTESRYFELLIDLLVSTTDVPSCVKYTGASPKISENGTWLVFNDEINAFEDTGISIFGKSAYQAAIESGNFSGTEEDFNAYMGSIPQITNDAILATESANNATENANKAGAYAVRIATDAANEATTAKENAENATEQAKEATANANSAAQRANEEVGNLKDKADTEGYYPNMSVGMADNLVGRGDVQDAQINFRPSAGAENISDAAARVERIKGNSVVYNQLVGEVWKTNYPNNAIVQYYNGIITININTFIDNNGIFLAEMPLSIKSGDIVYISYGIKLNNASAWQGRKIRTGYLYSTTQWLDNYNDADIFMDKVVQKDLILKASSEKTKLVIGPYGSDRPAIYEGQPSSIEIYYPILVNLTKMFGAGNEPTTIEEYYQRKPMNIEDEFAYNEGELIDMKVNSLISTSDNAFNPLTFTARVMGGYKYDITANEGATLLVSFYADGEDPNEEREIAPDSEGKYIFPANGTCYVNGDPDPVSGICVCLNHSYTKPHPPYQQEIKDLSFIGEEFPEGMRSTGSAFDEIRFNTTNNVWEKVVRVGVRAYAEGDAEDSSVITDGKTTNYPLDNPTPTTIDLSPNFNLDYFAWDFGTEEAIASVPSAPFRADINYEPNAVDDLRWAVSEIRSLRAELALLQSAQVSETNLTE